MLDDDPEFVTLTGSNLHCSMSRRRTMSQHEQGRPLLNDTESQHSDSSGDYEWPEASPSNRCRRILTKMMALARPSIMLSRTKKISYCFVPQIIRTYVFDDPAPKAKEFSTSYLNGLRGMTAVKVFTFHYFMVFTDATHIPYGATERYTYWTELPYIRYVWTGFTSHIFFALAGYLTCQRLFILLDKNDQASQAKVLLNVSSSLFRRGFRLYLPTILITLLMTTYIHLGFYEHNRPFLLNRANLFPGDWNEQKPDMYNTWYEQLKFWRGEISELTNFVNGGTFYPLHDQHLWSILAEMRASLHLHGIIIALAQVRRPARLMALCVLVLVYMWFNHWEVWVYILGAIVAQIDQILNETQCAIPLTTSRARENSIIEKDQSLNEKIMGPKWWERQQVSSLHDLTRFIHIPTAYQALRITGFLIAFYLLSYPIHGSRGDRAPGFETLNLFIPEWMERKDKFYANWGSFLLILLLVRSDTKTSKWRKMTSHWLLQYLGKISFAFYLVQQIIQHAFGYMIPQYVWWSFGVEGIDTTDLGWISAIGIGWTLTLIATLWMADCWNREVEGRCMKFVKWIETKTFR